MIKFLIAIIFGFFGIMIAGNSQVIQGEILKKTTGYEKIDDEGNKIGSYDMTVLKTDEQLASFVGEVKSLRRPDSYTYIDKNKKNVSTFFAGDIQKKSANKWYLLEYKEEKQKTISLFGVRYAFAQGTTTSDIYPSYDGAIRMINEAVWADAHDALVGEDLDSSDNEIYAGVWKTGGGGHTINRGYFVFDTAAVLPADAEIGTSSLHLYITDHLNDLNDDYDYMAVVEFTPASSTNIVLDDYDQFNAALFSNKKDLTTDFTNNAYNYFILNAAATSSIATAYTGGYTELGLREGNDIENVAFGGGADDNNRITYYTIEQTGVNNDPFLRVWWATSTEEQPATGTPTVYASGCTPEDPDDLCMITACSYASTSGITYTNYRARFILYLILLIPMIFVFLKLAEIYEDRMHKWTRR